MKILNYGYERVNEEVANAKQQEQGLFLPDYTRYRIQLYGEVRNCFRSVRFLREAHVRRFGNGLRLFLETEHQ